MALGFEVDPLIIAIPAWIDELVRAAEPLGGEDDYMHLAIALSSENVQRGGGPFGAIVCGDGRVIAAGVNRVLDCGLSIAHAEIVALMRAQQRLRERADKPAHLTLFASTEPCCQCFGAVVWSGVQRLVCGASTADAEAIGFDEGPKPSAWPQELEARGVSVALGVQGGHAKRVLEEYAARGGPIYGLRSPGISGAGR